MGWSVKRVRGVGCVGWRGKSLLLRQEEVAVVLVEEEGGLLPAWA